MKKGLAILLMLFGGLLATTCMVTGSLISANVPGFFDSVSKFFQNVQGYWWIFIPIAFLISYLWTKGQKARG